MDLLSFLALAIFFTCITGAAVFTYIDKPPDVTKRWLTYGVAFPVVLVVSPLTLGNLVKIFEAIGALF